MCTQEKLVQWINKPLETTHTTRMTTMYTVINLYVKGNLQYFLYVFLTSMDFLKLVCYRLWNKIWDQNKWEIFLDVSRNVKWPSSELSRYRQGDLTMTKPSTVWITINCGKFWKRWEYQTTWPASWETCMQVRKQQLELDMKQQTGSK